MSRHKTRLSLYAYGVILIGVRPEDDALSLVSPTLSFSGPSAPHELCNAKKLINY